MTIPRVPAGSIDDEAFRHHIRFLFGKGIRGFALNGATGEYCLTSRQDLATVLRAAREVVGNDSTLLAGIGSAGRIPTLEFLQIAKDEGANGVLLPMPYFFPYKQEDLCAFVHSIGSISSLPVLLYNLPAFTTPLETLTSVSLIRELERVVGIKDSSGSLDTVRMLTEEAPTANRVIGHDSVLYEALRQELCDGVVSGVACVLPELMLGLYQAANSDASSAEAIQLRNLLDDFIEQLSQFPVPWGLKIIAEERGFGAATSAQPLSARRLEARRRFIEWFAENRQKLLAGDSALTNQRS